MLSSARRFYDRHQAYMSEAERLRVEQDAAARGAGMVLSGEEGSHVSKLEAAAATSQHDSIAQRVYNAVATFDVGELRDMLTDFSSDADVNHHVVMGSLASTFAVWCQVGKAHSTGALYDGLTSAFKDSHRNGEVSTANGAVGIGWARHSALLLLVLSYSLGEWACNIAKDYNFARARAARVVVTRARYLSAMLHQDISFHTSNKASELSQRLQSDPDALDDAAIHSLERLLRGLSALACAVHMLLVDWRTFVLGLALRLPFAFQMIERSIFVVTSYERLAQHAMRKAQARAAESLSHVGSIQAHTAEASEVGGYRGLLASYADVSRSASGATAVLRHSEAAFYAVSDFITLAFGAWRIYTGQLSLGAFTSHRAQMSVVIQEFNFLEWAYTSLRSAAIQSRKYYALLRRVPATGSHAAGAEAESSGGASGGPFESGGPRTTHLAQGLRQRKKGSGGAASRSMPWTTRAAVPGANDEDSAPAAGRLTFEGVSFSYPLVSGRHGDGGVLRDNDEGGPAADGTSGGSHGAVQTDVAAQGPARPLVLQDVSFTVKPGHVVALVGESGSGKSTITRLCLRFYEPCTGRISLDGADIAALPMHSLRRSVGVVEQDSALLDRSVRDNLTLGLVGAAAAHGTTGRVVTQQEIEDACRAANAHDFIAALPAGYDTVIGDRGGRLSGGQRQRLQIARALLRNPQVLILDEATSALDSANEAAVTAALRTLMAGRGVIIIAHRLSTVRAAHEILVLSKGRIVERGSHDSLVATQGLYARLLQCQAGGRDG